MILCVYFDECVNMRVFKGERGLVNVQNSANKCACMRVCESAFLLVAYSQHALDPAC